MDYCQGDIVIVPFPFTDGTTTKVRPAVVLSNNLVNKTQDVILAQITSNLRKDEFSYFLDDSYLSVSLRKPSQVRCHKIFVMEKGLIFKKISKLKESYLKGLTNTVVHSFV